MEIHEILGREVDEIEDVQRRFERAYTEDYFNPRNGDWISNDYFRIIDLSTKSSLTEDEEGKLSRSINRLNEKRAYIGSLFGKSCLLDAYNEIAWQVNGVNLANPNLTPMLPALPTFAREV